MKISLLGLTRLLYLKNIIMNINWKWTNRTVKLRYSLSAESNQVPFPILLSYNLEAGAPVEEAVVQPRRIKSEIVKIE